MNASRIKEKLIESHNLLTQYKKQLDDNPNSFAYKLQYESFQAHVRELEKEQELANNIVNGELLEFRLKGELVNRGKIPLETLCNIVDKISKAFGFLAYRTIHPNAKGQKYCADMKLELADIAYGSCKLYVSGYSTRDAIHFAETTNAFFEILNHDLETPMTDVSTKYGGKSLFYIGQLLEQMSKNNITAEFRLLSPSKNLNYWDGANKVIYGLEHKIKQIHEDITVIKISGNVHLIDKAGTLGIHEALPKNKFKSYKIRFDKDQLEYLKTMTIDSAITVLVNKKTIYHDSTSDDHYSYSLLEVQE